MASGIYNQCKTGLFTKLIDLVNDVIKVCLYSSSFSFTATDATYSTTNELATAGGYTQGGATLAGKGVTGTTTKTFDATDTAWTSATFTARFAVLVDTTDSNHLICAFDFGADKSVSAGTFTLVYDAAGIITLT